MRARLRRPAQLGGQTGHDPGAADAFVAAERRQRLVEDAHRGVVGAPELGPEQPRHLAQPQRRIGEQRRRRQPAGDRGGAAQRAGRLVVLAGADQRRAEREQQRALPRRVGGAGELDELQRAPVLRHGLFVGQHLHRLVAGALRVFDRLRFVAAGRRFVEVVGELAERDVAATAGERASSRWASARCEATRRAGGSSS